MAGETNGRLVRWVREAVASAQTAFGLSAPTRRSQLLATMERLAALPTAVLARIFAFADGEFTTELYPAAPQLPAELFARLVRAGAASLRPAIDELRRDFDATVVRYVFDAHDVQRGDATPVEARLMTRLRARTARCLQLALEMLEFRRNFEVVKARAYADAFDDVRIHWDSVFALCPRLRRLDLSGMPLRSSHLPALLLAAARHCRELQSLVLPDKEWYRGPLGLEADVVMQALYAALEQWYAHNGGLRQLTIPQRTTHPGAATTRQALADELLLAVAAFCPELEHFDGWKVTLRVTDGVLRCDERVDCSLEVWAHFCRACPKLQEIQWCIFPFVDAFFEAFATCGNRAALRRLTLATNASSYRAEAAGADAYERLQWGCAAVSVFRAVAACPGLEQLSVLLQEELTEDGQPPAENIVSDALLETLAAHCPRLARLEILQADGGGSNMFTRDHRDRGIGNDGLARLATLPQLRVLRMNVGSHCGADGLVALVASAPRSGPAREIELVVGSYDTSLYARGLGQWTPSTLPPHKHCIQFHAVLLEFFALLVVQREQIAGRRVELTLHNGSSLYVDDEDAWQAQLEAVVAQLAGAYPTLRLRVLRQGGVAGATLSLGGAATRRASIVGVTPAHSRHLCASAAKATDWGSLAWYATLQALALTAAYKATARFA